ncbi:dipeptidase [Maricaulis parjimensis]|uniref:dipeptidase n=1 Tax=Maricaulis parjimensis TaxID=144023 RepID=UPI00193ABEDA|nr:dipeptidase [Maricaulis parjimensis]
MSKRFASVSVAALLVALSACSAPEEAAVETPVAEDNAVMGTDARDIHFATFTLDTHVDIGADYGTPALDPGEHTHAQVDLPKMVEGGLDAAFFIVYVRQGETTPEGYVEARAAAEEKYAGISRMLANDPDRIALATSSDEVEEIAASGRLVALIGMENAYPLGDSVDDVPMWAERGVRYMSITHFGNNQFGGSSNPNTAAGEPEEDPGLSDLGRELVSALNDNGIIIDVSHVGKTTMMEAIALSRAPVIASHSGARGVYDHARNLDDEQLRAIRDNGGVAQMVAFRRYIGAMPDEVLAGQQALAAELGLDTPEGREAATPEIFADYQAGMADLRAQYGDVDIAVLADHIDHAVEVAGIEHVGIASDFDGGGGVGGWEDASETPAVTAELLARGYTPEQIEMLWSGNVLRVLREVRAAASSGG